MSVVKGKYTLAEYLPSNQKLALCLAVVCEFEESDI